MADKEAIIDKMRERGFTVYATASKSIHFVSDHLYNPTEESKKKGIPPISIIVNSETEEFRCVYNLNGSINSLNCPNCSPVMNDDHFDRIVGIFETQAKWLSKLE